MSSPLLLDTCALIWLAENRMQPEAGATITRRHEGGETIFVSPISAWEIGLLFAKGRIRSAMSAVAYFARIVNLPGIQLAPMPPELLLGSSFLPGSPPRDPIDRIIAATVREYDLTVMTRDRLLLAYADEGHLSAVPC